MRVAFLLAVLLAAGLSGLLDRYWRPLACRLGKGYRLLRPALSLLSLGIFAKIASEVHEEETSSLDRAVSLAFRRLDSPVMDVIMRLFTALGSFPAIAAVVALVALWRILRSDKRGAVMLIAVAGATELLNLLLKEAFQRARPSLFTEGATLHSYSFPSGHAMASAAVSAAKRKASMPGRRPFNMASASPIRRGLASAPPMPKRASTMTPSATR